MSISISLLLIGELLLLYLVSRAVLMPKKKPVYLKKNQIPEFAKWPHRHKSSNRKF